jgi:hypothetical protein
MFEIPVETKKPLPLDDAATAISANTATSRLSSGTGRSGFRFFAASNVYYGLCFLPAKYPRQFCIDFPRLLMH